jgi:hypothetical protein
MKKPSLCSIVFLFSLASGAALAAQADDFNSFKTCIENTTNATCTLPYYSTPYLVTSTINATRSLTIQGTSGGSSYPVLMRPNGSTSMHNLLVISGNVSVTLQDLVFDGNRQNNGIPNYPGTASLNTVNGVHIEVYAGPFADVVASYTGSNTGCWRCVVVNNVTFQNSVGYGLQMSRSGVEVEYCTFKSAFLSGAMSWESAGQLPLIYLEIYWSTFDDAGGSAIAFNNAGDGTASSQTNPNKGPNVNQNQFFENGREFPDRYECGGGAWGPCPLGQIFNVGTGLTAWSNTIDGNHVTGSYLVPTQPTLGTGGFEIYNSGHLITGNPVIKNHVYPGIGITGGQNTKIIQNVTEFNNTGVQVRTATTGQWTNSHCVNVVSNTIENNSGTGVQLLPATGAGASAISYLTNTYSGNGTNYTPPPAGITNISSCPSYVQ